MTTVLADWHAKVMVADSGATANDTVWTGARKVWRREGCLFGFAGPYEEIEQFLAWRRGGVPPAFKNAYALVLSPEGLHLYAGGLTPVEVHSRIDAIGSGREAALAAYTALEFKQPRKAVSIACLYDQGSAKPVRSYLL